MVDPRWFVVLLRQKMELFDIEGDDKHHSFANGMLNIESFDKVEDCDEISMRIEDLN